MGAEKLAADALATNQTGLSAGVHDVHMAKEGALAYTVSNANILDGWLAYLTRGKDNEASIHKQKKRKN